MLLETTKEDICVNQLIGRKTQMLMCEEDIIIPDVKPDIVSSLNTSGNICVYKKEISDGKMRFDGSILIYIMYLADSNEGVVRGLNATLDFSEIVEFPGLREGMNVEDEFVLKNIDCKVLNGRKINISATVELSASAYFNETTSMVKDINNIGDVQVLSKNLELNSLLGIGNTKAYAKETIMIDNIDNLAEILSVHTRLRDKDIKPSYNKILAKADFEVRIMYLTEDNRINSVSSKIPVMGFIDVQDVSDTSICNVRYKLKNMIVKPNSTEEHSIYVEAELELICNVYESKELNIIQDMYSPSKEIEFTQKNMETNIIKNNKVEICCIKEDLSIPEIGDNKVYDVDVNPVILNQKCMDNKIAYEGEVKLKFVFQSNNVSGIDIKNTSVPFNFEIEAQGVVQSDMLETEIEIKRDDFVINAGNVNTNIELEFHTSVLKSERIHLLEEINVNDLPEQENYSMVVYFVKPSDSLWKIAKRFKSTIEDIARVNEISDINKIEVGQQLFIPRYFGVKVG